VAAHAGQSVALSAISSPHVPHRRILPSAVI
jgi:hypothetical protein